MLDIIRPAGGLFCQSSHLGNLICRHFFIKVMNDEGQSTVTYSLQSKTGTVDEALFEISSDYKELIFIEFMSVSE